MSTDTIEPSVLVVDDEREVADSYTLYVESEYDVQTAYGGRGALETVTPETDIVLLDRRMPDVSGDEVLQTIRDRELGCRVIIVTAVNPGFDILDMPFDDYLCKPVERTDILDSIDQQLQIIAYEVFREYFQLASKQAVLETQLTQKTLDSSSEYAEINDRLAGLEARLRGLTDEFEEVVRGFEAIDREV